MASPLTQIEREFLAGLRVGDPSSSALVAWKNFTEDTISSVNDFKTFLATRGQANPQGRDLFLNVNRQELINSFEHVDGLPCLIFQCCFGLNRPLEEGGQIQLVHKGNMFQKSPEDTDETVFNTIYTEEENGEKVQKLFVNLNSNQTLTVDTGHQYTTSFRNLYLDNPGGDLFTHGFLLPCKALLKVFNGEVKIVGETDVSPLGISDNITFQWGLTSFLEDGTLGNFTLIIGLGSDDTGEITSGPIIEFWWDDFAGTGSEPVPCPPNPGCN